MPSPRDFRGSRRELALVFSDGPRTANEASKVLGKPTGSFFGVLKRMHADGLLIADTDPPTRGTQYRLAPEAREALRHAAADESQPGTIMDGQQLLLVGRPTNLIEVQRLLARESLSGSIVWAAEVAGGWMLALDAEITSSFARQRLEVELTKAGVACQPLHVTALLSGRELRDRAAWLLEELKAPP